MMDERIGFIFKAMIAIHGPPLISFIYSVILVIFVVVESLNLNLNPNHSLDNNKIYNKISEDSSINT